MVEKVLENCDYELDILGRDKEVLKRYTQLPYPRISYDDAIKLLQESGKFPDVKWGEDFRFARRNLFGRTLPANLFLC